MSMMASWLHKDAWKMTTMMEMRTILNSKQDGGAVVVAHVMDHHECQVKRKFRLETDGDGPSRREVEFRRDNTQYRSYR
jgi:hypothetical protein